jgi:4-hydroxy-4-methyl-2-oxoglutarate aldolase
VSAAFDEGADEVTTRLAQLDTCACSDALDRLGLPGAVLGLASLGAPRRIAGRVVTVRVGPRTDDVARPHLGARAIAAAAPGEVIVVDHRGRLDVSAWGGILSLAARERGVAGVIVDGACRDLDDARSLGFPVFARAGVPVSARGRIVEEAFNEPVAIAGVGVAPGDYVVADASGVVFVAGARVEEVVELAWAIAERETAMAEAVRAGASIIEVMHDDRFEEIRPARPHKPAP